MSLGFILPLTVTVSCYASIVTSLHSISSAQTGDSCEHDLDPAAARQQRARFRKEKDILKYEYSLAKVSPGIRLRLGLICKALIKSRDTKKLFNIVLSSCVV